ncbi:MAG: hypothetical protein A2Z32_10530 [Chloroflexi bacterium RBG_16_69_14]|jgi:hypothetical protein|nr:MAG: hypothetical protein A2Z32_10530 [Chloroflexi bacterium RBG_16_69_14]
MKRRRIGGLLVGLVATLALATNAYATPAGPVTITVETHVDGFQDPFVSTGGVVCAAGVVSNGSVNFVGWQNGSHAQIRIVKHFECDDGTFDVLLRVTLDFAACDTVATWSVLDGTGAYEALRGAGSLTGDGDCGDTIVDAYVGSMHFD